MLSLDTGIRGYRMRPDCAHDDLEYETCGDGIIDWVCKECGEVIDQMEDFSG